jgi:hypothetical protein
MRILLLVLFSAISVFAEDPQTIDASGQVPDNLSIPVQLSKTIDTKKCKAGDKVEMRTLEPVLIAHGLVMPENAKLHGKIMGAASRQDDKPSWLLLLVNVAEWKDHTMPLRAFIAAQITVKTQVTGQSDDTFDRALSLPETMRRRRPRRELPQGNPGGSDLSAAMTRPPQASSIELGGTQQLSYRGLDDLRLMRDKYGRVFLVSQKPHLKVPSGTMFMLRNHATVADKDVAAKKDAGSPQ